MPSIALEIIRFIVNLIVLSLVFYLAGVIVVGRKRALMGDAFIIALLGTMITTFFMALPRMVIFTFDRHEFGLGPGLGLLISFFAYLLLIRHYYETGWLGALAVAILAVVIFVVLAFILAIFLLIPFLLFT